MASLRDALPSPEETNAAMRVSAGEIRDTIAKCREVIAQSRESIARANRILDGQKRDGTAHNE